MTRLVFSIDINAPREIVWDAITHDASYRKWARAFQDGSFFEGGWNQGDAIHFLMINEDGEKAGMVSEIAEIRHPEFISIRHLGMITAGEVDTTSDAVKEWLPSIENYNLEKTGEHTTRFHLDMDILESYFTMMESMWMKALMLLKDLCEDTANGPGRITVSALVAGEEGKVWAYWTDPDHIMAWNAASDDWHCPHAENDVHVGGKFKYTMAAKDGSTSFDFSGEYTTVEYGQRLAYTMDDGRKAEIVFSFQNVKICVMINFDAEKENSLEVQRTGWQAILDKFKQHVEQE